MGIDLWEKRRENKNYSLLSGGILITIIAGFVKIEITVINVNY